MSWDEPEYDLLAAFRARFGLNEPAQDTEPETDVLESARHVYNNAIDVSIDMQGTQSAAKFIHDSMKSKDYSVRVWSEHELHPKATDKGVLDLIFTIDLMNFSFWTDEGAEPFTVEYRDKSWTGYWALVAALRRALDEDIPITSSDFWQNEEECTEELLRQVFRSSTSGQIPMLSERLNCLRQAGTVLYQKYDCSVSKLVKKADQSAARLVNLLAADFSCFQDETYYEDRKVRFLKRAQILAADLWACFEGESWGEFHDIDCITIFADYRIPQMLHSLGCLTFSPPLDSAMRRRKIIAPGSDHEVQLRGCSIWAIELIKREIAKKHPKAEINAILIDYFLWDTIKEQPEFEVSIPHHRTRTVFY